MSKVTVPGARPPEAEVASAAVVVAVFFAARVDFPRENHEVFKETRIMVWSAAK